MSFDLPQQVIKQLMNVSESLNQLFRDTANENVELGKQINKLHKGKSNDRIPPLDLSKLAES